MTLSDGNGTMGRTGVTFCLVAVHITLTRESISIETPYVEIECIESRHPTLVINSAEKDNTSPHGTRLQYRVPSPVLPHCIWLLSRHPRQRLTFLSGVLSVARIRIHSSCQDQSWTCDTSFKPPPRVAQISLLDVRCSSQGDQSDNSTNTSTQYREKLKNIVCCSIFLS